MSSIAINDLDSSRLYLKTISDLQSVSVLGGTQVWYLDSTGDGVPDFSLVLLCNGEYYL